VLTFVALGGTGRPAGRRRAARLGFQLQSPAVVSALAILFFVLALNLSGVFEFGQLAPSGVDQLDRENSHARRLRLRRPRRRRRVAVHRAVHGCRARLRAERSRGVDAGRSSSRSASAWRCPTSSSPGFPDGGDACPVPVRGSSVQAGAGVSAVRDGDLARWVLGAQRDNDALLRLLLALLGIGFALWACRIVRTGGARPWGIAGLVVLRGGHDHRLAALRAEPVPAAGGQARSATTPVDAVHAGHGCGAHASGRPVSSTSPRRGA
jgi:hypothetical protein